MAGALFNNSEKERRRRRGGRKGKERDHRQSKRGKFLIIIEPCDSLYGNSLS